MKQALIEEFEPIVRGQPPCRVINTGEEPSFSVIDLGSNNGYFALQTAKLFPSAAVIGVEGVVGVGNGSLGSSTTDWQALCGTTAVQTHLRWTQKLKLENCLLAPEVWDFRHIKELS